MEKVSNRKQGSRSISGGISKKAKNMVKVNLSQFDYDIEISEADFYNKYLPSLSNSIRDAISNIYTKCGNEFGYIAADAITMSRFIGMAQRDSVHHGVSGWYDTITNQHGYTFTVYHIICGIIESLGDMSMEKAARHPSLVKDALIKSAQIYMADENNNANK